MTPSFHVSLLKDLPDALASITLFDLTRGMTMSTVRDIHEALLAVLALGLCLLVLVASVTGVGNIVVWMADIAGDIAGTAVIQGQGVIAQARRRPANRQVAGCAVGAKLSAVEYGFQVAGDAAGGQRVKRTLRVARFARQRSMGTFQRKDNVVIEICHGCASTVTGQAA